MKKVLRDIEIPRGANEQAQALLGALGRRSAAAVHKAGLHMGDPGRHPIDRGRPSLERVLVEIAGGAPPARSQAMRAAPARARAGALFPGVDFATARPAEDQIGLPGFRWRDLMRPVQGGDPGPAPAAGALELRVHSVQCVKDSKEWGKDEIDLSGVVSVAEKVGNAPARGVYSKEMLPFRVGSFKKGQTIGLGRRVIARLPVDSGAFPKVASATILLVEKDLGDQKWLVDALKKAKEWGEKQLRELLVGSDPNLFEEALGYAIKFALDAILKPILRWVGDDVFDPTTITATVAGADAVAEGGGRTTAPARVDAYIKGGDDPNAHYVVTYDWNLA